MVGYHLAVLHFANEVDLYLIAIALVSIFFYGAQDSLGVGLKFVNRYGVGGVIRQYDH